VPSCQADLSLNQVAIEPGHQAIPVDLERGAPPATRLVNPTLHGCHHSEIVPHQGPQSHLSARAGERPLQLRIKAPSLVVLPARGQPARLGIRRPPIEGLCGRDAQGRVRCRRRPPHGRSCSLSFLPIAAHVALTAMVITGTRKSTRTFKNDREATGLSTARKPSTAEGAERHGRI
jgi:hypothetical protein